MAATAEQLAYARSQRGKHARHYQDQPAMKAATALAQFPVFEAMPRTMLVNFAAIQMLAKEVRAKLHHYGLVHEESDGRQIWSAGIHHFGRLKQIELAYLKAMVELSLQMRQGQQPDLATVMASLHF